MAVIFMLILVAVFIIGWLCYAWMESTRASQRRSEAQNQRVIELLEEIVSELRADRSLWPAKAGSQTGEDSKTTG